jgi:hypothetical protein
MYELEIENELAELDDELEIEVDCMSIDAEIGSDSSLSSLSSSSSSSPDSSSTPIQKKATPMTWACLTTSNLSHALNNRLDECLEKPKSCDFIKNILPLLPDR